MGFLDNEGLAAFWGKVKGYVDEHGGSSGPVNWDDINGRPDLNNAATMKAQPVTLLSDSWTDNEQAVSIADIAADETAQLIIPVPASKSKALYASSGVQAVSQGEGTLTFQAGTVPAQDLSVTVYILSAAEVGQEYVGPFEWWSPHMTGDNAPSPYSCSASSDMPGFGSSGVWAAFDGELSKYWANDNLDDNIWISFDFGETAVVDGLKLFPRQVYPSQLPITFSVKISDDNANWESVYEASGLPKVAEGEPREVNFKGYKRFRYIKIEGMQSTFDGGAFIGIADIQFHKRNDSHS